MYRYILRESCSQFDSLPLTSLTISHPDDRRRDDRGGRDRRDDRGRDRRDDRECERLRDGLFTLHLHLNARAVYGR